MPHTKTPSLSPFHAGEIAIHDRLGIREQMHDVGSRVIRPVMPEQHQRFYEQLPFVLVGSVDGAGRPWASVLVGPPGFVRASDATQLTFQVRPVPGDPLGDALVPGAQLGFLGIELHTRRRNRVNGHILTCDAGGFVLKVDQTVGNCPQYIQGRQFRWLRDPADLAPRGRVRLAQWDAPARALIERADTLFIATHAPAAEAPANGATAGGSDVSHRGGRRGFVKIEDDRTLLIPDFTGNFLFMTLGNLQVNPRAGLLFIDFESGALLLLSGSTEIVWSSADLRDFDGAERAVRFRLETGWRLCEALPLRWDERDQSPNSARTGTWPEAHARQRARQLAQSWRPYRVDRIVDESSVIRSFHLRPADDQGLPSYQAGQHLPIRLTGVEGAEMRRTYTISQAPGDPGLRLSIKREGLASSHMHDHVHVGDIIEALGPRGQFTIDAQSRRPAVLIGAGVGITPMIAFARHLVAEGRRTGHTRPVHCVQVARNESLRAFGVELRSLQELSKGSMRLHVVLDDPAGGPGDAHTGPLSVDLLKQLLPWEDHEFFLCGPPAFMQKLYDGLRDLGIRDERIQAESFGPSALKRRLDGASAQPYLPAAQAQSATVVFKTAGKVVPWTPGSGTLLELAEANGLSPPFSCRAGHCGSCVTHMTLGRVSYDAPTAWKPGRSEVLLCRAVPAANGGEHIELDL